MASSSKSTGKSSKSVVDNEVSLFWDLSTCPISDVSKLKHIVKYIENSLADLHRFKPDDYPMYRLSETKVVRGDLVKLGAPVKKVLEDLGFEVHHAVERGDGPSPGFLLDSYLLRYAGEHRDTPPGNILFITGDYCFGSSMNNFYNAKYTIFLAKRRDSHPKFGEHTHYGWNWEDMERGMSGMVIYHPSPL